MVRWGVPQGRSFVVRARRGRARPCSSSLRARAKKGGNMNISVKLGGLLGLSALALGLAACSGAEGDGSIATSEEALSSPVNPIAFCQASELNVIIGTQRSDVINGTAAADCIVALGGQDTINAGGGDDIVFAGEGDDVVNGGDGNDALFGGQGQDQL